MTKQVLVTGATGLIGGEVLQRLLRADRSLRAHVIVRQPARWLRLVRELGPLAARVTPHTGDLTLPGLDLGRARHRAMTAGLELIVHCAADTRFSQTLPRARRHNRDGTRHLLELAADCAELHRFVHVSTAFVAGRMTGSIPEAALDGTAGFVNAYERSKHEAERAVRRAAVPWMILRPSTVVCDSVHGHITQVNAVHRALLLCRAGLASMVPGGEDTPVDLVTTDYVASAIARLAVQPCADGGTYHLCAGDGALPLGELLDRCWHYWRQDERWSRRGVARPSLTTLATYRLFEAAVERTGDTRLKSITRSLTHFVPQLALPKHFMTQSSAAALGYAAPAVRTYWSAVLDSLGRGRRRAAEAA